MWEKNWEILMAVLRDEDFPLLRASQRAAIQAAESGVPAGTRACQRAADGLVVLADAHLGIRRDVGSFNCGRRDGRD